MSLSSSSSIEMQPKIDQVFLPSAVSKQKEEMITQLITKMICMDTLPISIVQNKGFQKLLSYLAPFYKIPVPKTIQLRIDAMYEKEKNNLLTVLKDANYIALTTDCWTSRATESYITVSCHYIDKDWRQRSYNITTENMEDRHTAENLQKKIEEIISEWNIGDKCIAIVHDNAHNIVAATKNLPYQSIRCYAHTLQLVLTSILSDDTILPTLKKCTNIVSHFNHSNIASSALSVKQSQFSLPIHKLIQSVKTRWNSTYYMLQRLLEQREAVISVLSDRAITTRQHAVHLMLDENEWINMECLVKMLAPFELATTLLSSESQPTVSMIMPILKSIRENFIAAVDPQDSDFIKSLKQMLKNEFDHKFKNILDEFSICAEREIGIYDLSTLLDPRFKNKERFIGSITKTKKHLLKMLDDFKPEEEDSETPAKKSKCSLDMLFPNENDVNYNEVDVYLLECVIPKNACPLNWWKNNEIKYPKLSKYAKQFLCIPATSVPSERAFSKAGNIVTSKRSCLKSSNVKKICFLSSNLT